MSSAGWLVDAVYGTRLRTGQRAPGIGWKSTYIYIYMKEKAWTNQHRKELSNTEFTQGKKLKRNQTKKQLNQCK